METINPIRITQANEKSIHSEGDYVLYWMTAFRRTKWNHALQRATQLASDLNKPLIVFEPLRVNYRWASDRFHRFVIEGMRSNEEAFQHKSVTYLPYVEPTTHAASGILEQLSQRACCVVTDDYPCFFLPALIREAKKRIGTRFEVIDSNCIIPIRLADRTFTVAHSYRRWMQKNIIEHLAELPEEDPLSGVQLPVLDQSIVKEIQAKWPKANFDQLLDSGGLDSLPIDHSVPAVAEMTGGEAEASNRLRTFIGKKLAGYDSDRNHPDFQATSRLSPYLHFGHLSSFEFVQVILKREKWSATRAGTPNGKNTGFWNLTASSEGLMDQIITWRDLGFNFAARHPREIDRYESLPNWAKTSLSLHSSDPRPHLYDLHAFETASTHDPVWNAAQRELVSTGMLHNYMRMLWGKQILHWSKTPREALKVLIHLNNKYALDGRDPNSYSGIFWVLGRYDRAWGPKRPVFGSVRYMTSESAQRKLKMKKYLAKHSPSTELF